MSAVVDLIRSTPAWILDHPILSAGVVVGLMATWTLGGLYLHFRSDERRARRANGRRHGL